MPKHLEFAESYMDKAVKEYYERKGYKISFAIQSAPIKEVGVNGLQAFDILIFVKNLFVSLNSVFPCRENAITITKLEEAIHWQEARTRDRVSRNVEGYNKS